MTFAAVKHCSALRLDGNGTIGGGVYFGPDYSAEALREIGDDTAAARSIESTLGSMDGSSRSLGSCDAENRYIFTVRTTI